MNAPLLPGVSISLIQQLVAKRYKVPLESMASRDRRREFTYPRQLAMALSREFTRHSQPMIGGRFGGRDHSTVYHARRAVEQRAERDRETAEHLSSLRVMLEQMAPRPVENEVGNAPAQLLLTDEMA